MPTINDLEFETCEQCGGSGELPTADSLKAARMAAKKPQRLVAKAMGIGQQYLSKLENGRREWNYGLIEEFERALKPQRSKRSSDG